MKTVFVGMSGGVDSSLAAALLKEQGYKVVGVFMKNWTQDIGGFECPWKQDYQDALNVAVGLDIELKLYDFETQYRSKVVDYMLAEYQAGRTPNPDIMCNQEVKFKLFLQTALDEGADMIATGHYARIDRSQKEPKLIMAQDTDKDQTYFLYRINRHALNRTLLPIGDFINKSAVRAAARQRGLVTAEKKDSQGICFVGKIGIKEFLSQFVVTNNGPIIDQQNRSIGEHDGAIFYTIGQRRGLNIGGGLPYYVTGKNMIRNEVYVTTDLDDRKLWQKEINLHEVHWINQIPTQPKLKVRSRHRAPLLDCRWRATDDGIILMLQEPVRAITPGQSAVLYHEKQVVGGGIVV